MTRNSLSQRFSERRPRILIVDDEPDIVRALGMRLTTAGYEVLFAGDGVEAIASAIREQPDLILLDIGLPAGDGHTVAGWLKTNLKTKRIPLVFLTARTAATDINKARAVNAAAYLHKPYRPDVLLSHIEKALERR